MFFQSGLKASEAGKEVIVTYRHEMYRLVRTTPKRWKLPMATTLSAPRARDTYTSSHVLPSPASRCSLYALAGHVLYQRHYYILNKKQREQQVPFYHICGSGPWRATAGLLGPFRLTAPLKGSSSPASALPCVRRLPRLLRRCRCCLRLNTLYRALLTALA